MVFIDTYCHHVALFCKGKIEQLFAVTSRVWIGASLRGYLIDMCGVRKMLQPDLVIIDVDMPGITGIEVAIHDPHEIAELQNAAIFGKATTAELLESARAQGHDFEPTTSPG